MQRSQGFTLIELMITIAIIGILASIAYPSYESAMVKNRRASAQSYLSDVAQRQQQYLLDNRAYAADKEKLNAPEPTDVLAYYKPVVITLGTAAVPSFEAKLEPLAGKSQASDGTLSINEKGEKKPQGKW